MATLTPLSRIQMFSEQRWSASRKDWEKGEEKGSSEPGPTPAEDQPLLGAIFAPRAGRPQGYTAVGQSRRSTKLPKNAALGVRRSSAQLLLQ